MVKTWILATGNTSVTVLIYVTVKHIINVFVWVLYDIIQVFHRHKVGLGRQPSLRDGLKPRPKEDRRPLKPN